MELITDAQRPLSGHPSRIEPPQPFLDKAVPCVASRPDGVVEHLRH